jgi:Flp pilus assembly protein TadD
MNGCLRLAMAASMLLGGCAAWRGPRPAADVAVDRQQRAADAVRTFEEQRDGAQFHAALDRWAAGDLAGCETRLRALLARRPNDGEVRLRLAELLWSRGAMAEAEAELQSVVTVQPTHAEAHHMLGMILSEQARLAEARSHLARAIELAPGCDDYRATLASLP